MDLRQAGRFVDGGLGGRKAFIDGDAFPARTGGGGDQGVPDAPGAVVVDRAFDLEIPFGVFHGASCGACCQVLPC
ncbi:hypothetical protein WJ978_29265 [Achromobacter xylosoxidans]